MTPENFKQAIRGLKDNRPTFEIVAAQWCVESDYGQSALSMFSHNFAGLKWRDDIVEHMPSGSKHLISKGDPHEDWDNKLDEYVYCADPYYFYLIYFAFLERSPYAKSTWIDYKGDSLHLQVTIKSFHDQPLSFMAHIVECGFCASVSGFHRKNYKTDMGYKRAVQAEYMRRVLKAWSSKKFRGLIEAI